MDVKFDGVLSLDENQPEYQEIIGKPSMTPEQKKAFDRPKDAPKHRNQNRKVFPKKPGKVQFDCTDLPFVEDSAIIIFGENQSRNARFH